MTRTVICEECGETKNVSEFVVKDGKRTKLCKDCNSFTEEIESMGDVTPIGELDLDDSSEDEQE